ncbi:MAG: hypothetical protein COA78_22265 [Blastopirellula sp.]|nr:MAG: hypothetical protein COA78_22265 [Blastopirellula sp.]
MKVNSMYRKYGLSLLLVTAIATSSFAQKKKADAKPTPDSKITYKKTEQGELQLHAFLPQGVKPGDNRPGIVFFFGGGWTGGTPAQFYTHARYLADKGMPAFCAEYRVAKTHKTDPFACVEDGKSAVRYVREHAKELGVDPKRIVAAGGSAGGHVAATTGTIVGFEVGKTDISSRPQAMILFNPVIDTGPKGYGYSKLKERYKEISPVDHVVKGIPPTLIFHGTGDTTVPFENVVRFDKQMQDLGNQCKLVDFKGEKHGFFNYGRGDNKAYDKTIEEINEFLGALKYID